MKTMHPQTTKPDAARIPARWAPIFQQLQALHEQLLRNCSIQAASAKEQLEPHSMDMADSATDEFDHNLALGLLSHQQDAIFEVRAAIRRILDGRYGICEETGKAIPEARLRAVPWTRYTRDAAERLERGGVNERSHLGALRPVRGFAAASYEKVEEDEEDSQPGNEERSRPPQADGEASAGWLAAA